LNADNFVCLANDILSRIYKKPDSYFAVEALLLL